MKFSREIKLSIFYIKRYKVLVGLNLFVLFIASLLEGLGFGMIIPILQSIERKGQANIFTNYAEWLCALLNIDFNFLNLMIIFGVIMLSGYVIIYLQQYLSRVLSASVTYELRNRAFQNLMDLPLSYYYKEKIGNIIATLYTSSNNSGAVIEMVMQAFTGLIFCIVYISLNSLISLPLTLIACLLTLVSYFLIIPRFKIGFTQGDEEKQTTDRISSFLIDKLGGIKTLKSFNNEGMHLEDFGGLARGFKRLQIKIQNNRILANLFLEPFTFVLIITLLIVSVEIYKMPIVYLITFFFIFSRTIPKIKVINSNYMQIMELLPHFVKIEEIIRRDDKTYLKDGEKDIKALYSDIRFENVSFRYPASDEYVLKNVNILIEKDKITALIGVSGGGKTTLVDLIMRHHDPEKGNIKIDGIDLREIKRECWHRLVSMVEQETYLFNDTVYNNILYGRLDARKEDIVHAAKLANAHDFIEELPDKYDTPVGERGMKLSGGQKQRIVLARALIREPEILILDEAMSALDSESERLIQDSIERFSRSKTIIIIAHRISTIVNADKIIVIDNGEVVEEGSPEMLLKHGRVYKKYYALQQT